MIKTKDNNPMFEPKLHILINILINFKQITPQIGVNLFK